MHCTVFIIQGPVCGREPWSLIILSLHNLRNLILHIFHQKKAPGHKHTCRGPPPLSPTHTHIHHRLAFLATSYSRIPLVLPQGGLCIQFGRIGLLQKRNLNLILRGRRNEISIRLFTVNFDSQLVNHKNPHWEYRQVMKFKFAQCGYGSVYNTKGLIPGFC